MEELIKHQLKNILYENNLILKNHHGGRNNLSMVTVRACIDTECAEIVEENNLVVVLMTDLFAAYDTVDTEILLGNL